MKVGDLVQLNHSIQKDKSIIGIVMRAREWDNDPVVDVLITTGPHMNEVIGFKEENVALLSTNN